MSFDRFRAIILSCLGITALACVLIASSSDAFSLHKKITPALDSKEKQATFEKALKVVLEHEGYLSNDRFDKGGLTKWGISLRFLEDESIDVDGDGEVDREDIMHLTQTEADNIYFKYFWINNHYDRISNEKVAIKIFDIAVNTGSARAHKLLKKALNDVIYGRITVDRHLDDDTMQIVNLVEPVVLLDALRKEQAQFYLDIIKMTPSYAKFKKGWLVRAAW